MNNARIAIVGIGGLFPGAANLDDFWTNLEAGIDASAEVPPGRWPIDAARVVAPGIAVPDKVHTSRGYYLGSIPVETDCLRIDVDLLRNLDPIFHLIAYAGKQAWADAKTSAVDRSRVGVILGHIALPTEKASALAVEILGRTFAEKAGLPEISPRTDPLNRYVAGLPAGILAQALGLGGGTYTLDAACASSLYALKLAADELREGRADLMLTGGAARPDCLYTQMGFAQLRALSASGRCSPFDAAGDGLVVGEGCGIFALKRLADAERDGDRIYAVLAGVGLSNDVEGNLLAPASEGQLRAMRAAYQQADWRPSDVDLIECHATGTPVGDAVEFQSLKSLWTDENATVGGCPIGSVKSSVGHLLTGAGAAGLIKLLLAMRHGVFPPTANFRVPAKPIALSYSPFRVLTAAELWPRRPDGSPRRTAISGFGFGGINAHVLLEEYRPSSATVTARVPPARSEPVAIVGIGARFGPWRSLRDLRARMLGGGAAVQSAPQRNWWGIRESAWYRREFGDGPSFLGYYIDELEIAADQFRIPPNELREMLPQQLLALHTAAAALADVKDWERFRARAGIFLGLGLDLNTTNYHFRWTLPDALRDAGHPALNANRTMGALGSIAASRIARTFGFEGPSFTICSEDSSGGSAFAAAVRTLQRGELDLVVTGAVDLAGDARAMIAAHRCGARSGDVGGDGAACFILKRLSDAERDGDRIYAVVRGVGTANHAIAADAMQAATDQAVMDAERGSATACDATADVGFAGAASFAASLAKACFALDTDILPPAGEGGANGEDGRVLSHPEFWLRSRADGPRRASVSSQSVDGNRVHAILEEHAPSKERRLDFERRQPLGSPEHVVFPLRTSSLGSLRERLAELENLAGSGDDSMRRLGAAWHSRQPLPSDGLGLAIVAGTAAELRERIARANRHLSSSPDKPLSGQNEDNGIYFSPNPLAARGELAFVFPGSGNHFPGMGRELAARWPGVLRRQQQENENLRAQFAPDAIWDDRPTKPLDACAAIFGQVTFGTLVADILNQFGVRPTAALGYSLGESAALFALRAWTDRDEMYRRMRNSTLFISDLSGTCDAARTTWHLPDGQTVDWLTGVISCGAERLRAELSAASRVYLQIINSSDECVIGGERTAVEAVVRRIGVRFIPLSGISIAHCKIVQSVANAYRSLHRFPTRPPAGVRFYSGATGSAYDVTTETAADAILGHATATIDFPRLVESAYADGVRVFVEIGPGASCSRMIGKILDGRPHFVRSAAPGRNDPVGSIVHLLAQLHAEGVAVDFSLLFAGVDVAVGPPKRVVAIPVGGQPFHVPQVQSAPDVNSSEKVQMPGEPFLLAPAVTTIGDDTTLWQSLIAARSATTDAHASYLRFTENGTRVLSNLLEFHQSLIPRFAGEQSELAPAAETPCALDTASCFEFARGSIANVLGPDFAAVDVHPTRVRLPDGPLMLVDRILTIDGEPRSMSSGRVVTEHAVHGERWYIEEGHIPTSIAVESGQADLFLSGFLGIDFVTKGLAVYRLLDAVVTFHNPLPEPGRVIRYDIHIDRFFRQGETHLFRFRFEATVDGEPLLSMTNGIAGFFTAAELASGRGVVHTALDRRPVAGKRPDDWRDLVPMAGVESYGAARMAALRAGNLAGCFGPAFDGLPLESPLSLPGGMLRLVDRVVELDPTGGRFGLGRIRAEMDIRPDDWFLSCHFVDDMVMPGTLMYECCLHTLRVFLLRMGWIGDKGRVRFEPVPGVPSQLKCRGQVIASTKIVTYEVSVKELGFRPEPFAIADALMYADGKPIVEITNMTLRLTGSTRAELEQLWDSRPIISDRVVKHVLFDRDRITAFAVGNPSDAFGDRYRVFDRDRVIARLPGPPFQFLDRITEIRNCEPWVMAAGGAIVAEYDVTPDEWYFASNRQPAMPFAVLLEIALQPCGWLAAYLGSALTSPTDLSFRNLGGRATQREAVGPDAGTLVTNVKITKVSTSGGMVIQNYEYRVTCRGRTVYEGDTYFGFFSKASLAQQVGVRDAQLYQPSAAELGRAQSFPVPSAAPFPDERLRMVDQIDVFIPDGGPHGLGFIRGSKRVNPTDWFFKAHFHQDPVWPGSLGLEAFLQLLKVVANERWGSPGQSLALGMPHVWVYRGQVISTNEFVCVDATVVDIDDSTRTIRANGFLSVDGRVIYQMTDFTIRG